MSETFLVTGVLGCIGAWVARTLLREGANVVGYDLGEATHRLELVLEPDELRRVTLLRGDITDLEALEGALDEHAVTHVLHLAALQVPFARADPPLGARVNVLGTVNVFEAVKRRRDRIHGLAYASSAAVFGGDDGPSVTEDDDGHPGTHYGVHKLANEGAARVYWQDEGVPSIGLRPYVVYGPGRDQGLTAAPTLAMEAAARGEGFHIGFGGRTQLHYAPDVARALVDAARSAEEGAVVANVGGTPVGMDEVVRAIEAAAPEVAGKVSYDDVKLPFPEEFVAGRPARLTPLAEGVRATIEHFRGQKVS
jgi:nucleoside-diphosphate-sugar epimerase